MAAASDDGFAQAAPCLVCMSAGNATLGCSDCPGKCWLCSKVCVGERCRIARGDALSGLVTSDDAV